MQPAAGQAGVHEQARQAGDAAPVQRRVEHEAGIIIDGPLAKGRQRTKEQRGRGVARQTFLQTHQLRVQVLLRLLSARMAEDKSAEVYQFSSVTIDKLSQVIFDVAEHVEFYGVLRHRVDEFVRIVDQNVELVKPSI